MKAIVYKKYGPPAVLGYHVGEIKPKKIWHSSKSILKLAKKDPS